MCMYYMNIKYLTYYIPRSQATPPLPYEPKHYRWLSHDFMKYIPNIPSQ